MLTAKTDLTKIIFIKIETTTQNNAFLEVSPQLQSCFKDKFEHLYDSSSDMPTDGDWQVMYQNKAPLLAEFGRIVAISYGYYTLTSGDGDYSFKSKTISGDNEKELLETFSTMIKAIKITGSNYEYFLCGYALKGFDVPFLAKRMVINGLQIPKMLDTEGVKPWELLVFIDIAENWKMGAWDSYTSLQTLCAVFNIELTNYGQDEQKIVKMWVEDKKFADVSSHLENKLVAMATLYLRMKGIYNNVTRVSNN